MDKKVKKITCEIDKEDSDRIILTTYNKNDEFIETFKHDFRWNDEDIYVAKCSRKLK